MMKHNRSGPVNSSATNNSIGCSPNRWVDLIETSRLGEDVLLNYAGDDQSCVLHVACPPLTHCTMEDGWKIQLHRRNTQNLAKLGVGKPD